MKYNKKSRKKANRSMKAKNVNRPPKEKKTIETRLDGRKIVTPKYRCLETKQYWTGRGKPPRWVTELCEVTNISLKEFKTREEYKVDS